MSEVWLLPGPDWGPGALWLAGQLAPDKEPMAVSTGIKVALVTLGAAIPALFLSRILWPIAPGSPTPSGAQLPLFILLSILEALIFGGGVAFLAFGLPVVRRAAGHVGVPAWPVYLAVGWSLISWWPHNNFHLANGANLDGLLAIEYAFHVSLYLTGLIIAWFFLTALRLLSRPSQPLRSAR
jgi:hypothetical protein